MMRLALAGIVGFGVVACAPTVPDSAQGVGFENYDTYLARRQAEQAELAQRGTVPETVQAPQRQAVADTSPEATAAEAVAVVRGNDVAVVQARPQQTTQTAVVRTNNPSISDEQDFQAVSSRETIESDAERRQAQSSQYKVITPKALPRRPGDAAPTPIQFALSTSHPKGQKMYRRSPFGASKSAAICAQYDSVEKAQDQFLKNGGPEKDRLGLDPDGDGYACGWDPSVYRGLTRNSG